MGKKHMRELGTKRKLAGFSLSFFFALVLVLALALLGGSFSQQASAASAAYTAYTHQITILNNATGGECGSVGAWDQYQKSCTLNTDVADTTVWLTDSGVTLNGNSHTLTGGADVHFGVILGDNTLGITVENMGVHGFTGSGFVVKPSSSGGTITGNSVTNNTGTGISVNASSGDTISKNNVSNNSAGIWLNSDTKSTLSDNTVSGNKSTGITLLGSRNDTVSANTVDSNALGIYLGYSSTYNTYASYNTISGNTISLNGTGARGQSQLGNRIYHNNFLNNVVQVSFYRQFATWNLPAPTGGNYWSNWSTPDANNDGFVDMPYVIYGGRSVDYFPLTTPVEGGKPALSLGQPQPSWASVSDYQAGQLSVTWTVNNTGSAEAWSAQLTGSTDSNGVTLTTALPVSIGTGNILAGASGSVTLKYNVPTGVSSWQTAMTASAQDGIGATYIYP